MNQHISNILQAAGVVVLGCEQLSPTSLSSSISTTHAHDGITSARSSSDTSQPSSSSDATINATMESWLGLQEPDDPHNSTPNVILTTITVEDCLPLPDTVISATISWLVDAWSGSCDDSSIGTINEVSMRNDPFAKSHRNLYTNLMRIEALTRTASSSGKSTKRFLLEQTLDSIRATKWLRAWMEFNINNNDDNNNDDNSNKDGEDDDDDNFLCTSLSRRLLRWTYNSTKHPLLQALYQHVQDLPEIQQQVVSYSQYIQRAGTTSPTMTNTTESRTDPHSYVVNAVNQSPPSTTKNGIIDPQFRIQQYESAMMIGQQLQSEWQDHIHRLEFIVGDFYSASSAQQRCVSRQRLGHIWTMFLRSNETSNPMKVIPMTGLSVRHENTKAAAICMTLNVLRRILLGMSNTVTLSDSILAARNHLLFQQLMPLHEANGVVLWRDQTAILELYHEPLCQCIALLIQQLNHDEQGQLIPVVIHQLLQPNIFPIIGSTSKQVLLLHEVDTYLRLLFPVNNIQENTALSYLRDPKYLQDEENMMQLMFQTLARCMSSEHSRVAERALQFFQTSSSSSPLDKLIVSSSQRYLPIGLRILLPALVRREPSWNPTVRKMTYNVLKKLQSYDENMFTTICNEIFAHNTVHLGTTTTTTTTVDTDLLSPTTPKTSKLFETNTTSAIPSTANFSLKSDMGNWKPPSSSSSLSGKHNNNVPGRGMAPWASTKQPFVSNRGVGKSNVSAPPPLTITGVAPWAMQPQVGTKSNQLHPSTRSALTMQQQQQQETTVDLPQTGMDYVLANMENIKPPLEDEGVSSWSMAQMAETPTLLPTLKFHDLVFGHDLGSGAFGSVRYARLIDKSKTRSQWPEYAVKVVSTEKIREMGYEASIQREIAVLHFLSHPGIARLVSRFRFNAGAYLVLEYASRGDLHSLLLKNGSLDVESTRFVVGEVVAALARYGALEQCINKSGVCCRCE
jgi:Protein phosphatase 2A regulatory B subunit (B56 family)/Protein kinase domain